MDNANNNEKNTYGIEKFEGAFEKEEIGVTIIPTRTINDIRNPEALGVYVYLLARPKGWKLNVKQLREHFQCGQDKMYKILNWLLQETFIICTMLRDKGKYTKPSYRVLLHRQNDTNRNVEIIPPVAETQTETEFQPYTENPDTVKTDTENTETYKTEIVESIEDKNNTPIVPKGTECSFSLFWNLYPVKKGKKQCESRWKRLRLDEKCSSILRALQNQIENDEQWKRGFAPNPLTYINGELWNDEIVTTKPQGKSKDELFFI